MVVDRRQLFLLAFNFTYLDIEQSRSFGIITDNRRHVLEAVKLFEADTQRHAYTPASSTFVVSPVNARRRLAAFIQEAKKELLIYDPEVSDPAIIRLLEARSRAGVTVRIIGTLRGKSDVLSAKPMPQMRLHTRSIVRDGRWAFVGSQSLRALELDSRREVGIIFRDPKTVARLHAVFQEDWESKAERFEVQKPAEPSPATAKVAKRVAKAFTKDLDPVTPMVEMTVKEITGDDFPVQLNPAAIEETIKNAVKEAVREVVHNFVEDAIESPAGASHRG
jgi:phosphatidylserine/phosphatidylglycerophosphate/cardiolipin synthase-like enzyme